MMMMMVMMAMMVMVMIILGELRALQAFFCMQAAPCKGKGSHMHQGPAAHCGSCTAFGTQLLL